MSWAMTAIGASIAIGGYQTGKWAEGKFGEDEEGNPIQLPDYYSDEQAEKIRSFLGDTGMDILGGDIPDYYKSIGESGGQELEDLWGQMRGDINKSALELSAAGGRGVGNAMEIALPEIGRVGNQLRFADWERSLEGKKWAFGQGRGMSTDAMSAGYSEGARKNDFALSLFDKELLGRNYQNEQDQMFGSNIADIAGLAINTGVGYATGGPTGAVAGAMGGIDWGDILDSAAAKKTTNIQPSAQTTRGKAVTTTQDAKLQEFLKNLA